MEINNTKLNHASLTLMNNFYGTKTNYKQLLTIFSQEHKHKIHQTLLVWPTKRKEEVIVTLERRISQLQAFIKGKERK
jgi:hypothetical protein